MHERGSAHAEAPEPLPELGPARERGVADADQRAVRPLAADEGFELLVAPEYTAAAAGRIDEPQHGEAARLRQVRDGAAVAARAQDQEPPRHRGLSAARAGAEPAPRGGSARPA